MIYATDFEYDGRKLSDFGFVFGEINGSSGVENLSSGSKITFVTVPFHSGKKYGLTATKYDECIEMQLNICKDPCKNVDMEITDNEYRQLIRWLVRRKFLKFRLINDDDPNQIKCYYYSSFNVEQVRADEKLYGLSLAMTTNAPFGFGEEYNHEWTVTGGSYSAGTKATISSIAEDHSSNVLNNAGFTIKDTSDEIGSIYPDITITCADSGTLAINNWRDLQNNGVGETIRLVIKNCTLGEVIKITGEQRIIKSYMPDTNGVLKPFHEDIYDDFNFAFIDIANNMIGNKTLNRNVITAYFPCTIKVSYSPIIKGAI